MREKNLLKLSFDWLHKCCDKAHTKWINFCELKELWFLFCFETDRFGTMLKWGGLGAIFVKKLSTWFGYWSPNDCWNFKIPHHFFAEIVETRGLIINMILETWGRYQLSLFFWVLIYAMQDLLSIWCDIIICRSDVRLIMYVELKFHVVSIFIFFWSVDQCNIDYSYRAQISCRSCCPFALDYWSTRFKIFLCV